MLGQGGREEVLFPCEGEGRYLGGGCQEFVMVQSHLEAQKCLNISNY